MSGRDKFRRDYRRYVLKRPPRPPATPKAELRKLLTVKRQGAPERPRDDAEGRFREVPIDEMARRK
jgi:hypothetical protein